MYESILFIHNWFRWLVLVAGLMLTFSSLRGWKQNKIWDRNEDHLLWSFNQVFMSQLGLGLILYLGVSPIPKMAIRNLSESWKDPFLRFWTFEHGPTMLLSMCVFHLGRFILKRAKPTKKFKIMSMTMLIVIGMILLAIPWPFLDYGRPLFKGIYD